MKICAIKFEQVDHRCIQNPVKHLKPALHYQINFIRLIWLTLRKKCPYSESFWSAFFPDFSAFGLNTERHGISPYSVQMQENVGKMWTRITSNTDIFYAVFFSVSDLFNRVMANYIIRKICWQWLFKTRKMKRKFSRIAYFFGKLILKTPYIGYFWISRWTLLPLKNNEARLVHKMYVIYRSYWILPSIFWYLCGAYFCLAYFYRYESKHSSKFLLFSLMKFTVFLFVFWEDIFKIFNNKHFYLFYFL